jgi:CRP/FNR family cyclic AMP-dependent transcriptional regulator
MQILSELSSGFLLGCVRVRPAMTREFKNREIIYISRPAGTTCVVKRGYVRLVYIQQDGRPLTRMLLGKGAMFGDIPFRPGVFFINEQAIASGLTSVIEVDRVALENEAITAPAFQASMLQTLSAQYQALGRRLQWQLVSPLKKRIAFALVDLICFTGGRCGHGHLIDIRLTQEEFAELVVAARPVVSEVLGELRDEGIIEYTRSHLCLLSLDRLQMIADSP